MNQVEIRKEAKSYYLNLFKDDHPVRPYLDGLKFDRISSHEKRWIDRPFSEDEVHRLIMGIKGDKAPGPDGFTIKFFSKVLGDCQGDLIKVLDEFYYSKEFYEHLNNNFIVLIPKKKSAKEIKDFCSICLLSTVYKIISKNLVRHLKSVMKGIISPPQDAFIEGRQILNGILITNECIKNRRVSNSSRVICKLDLEKAYDHVNWRFFYYILMMMDFGAKWRSWTFFWHSLTHIFYIVKWESDGIF